MNDIKKKVTQRDIGFIQGIAYAAALAETFNIDGKGIIMESQLDTSLFKKYADNYDLEKLDKALFEIEEKKKEMNETTQ